MTSEPTRVERLMCKGVQVPNPAAVEISPDVDLDRISGDGVVIHSGCKIFGRRTFIGPRVELGREAPVTVEDCRMGKGGKLAGG
jgi:bifunctional N-acetylglucosamine-1-phosphate-uridyltransferase/glucosamine-1-phosphate-acetyltransferase GlmU-like protein